MDESTDVASQANLLAFVRFELNGNIEEEMLFCQSLSTKTTGEEIFKSVDSFIKENEVDWLKCVGLTTDGARAMSGIHTGLIARVRSVAHLVQWTHCSIHREALAVKGLDECLKKTLDDAVKIVIFIKARPTNSRLFGVLCDEMGSESFYFTVKFVGCQEVKCYQDCLSSVMNLGFSLWKGTMMENLEVPT